MLSVFTAARAALDRHGRDAGTLLLRLTLGTVFAFHGAQKLFGAFGGPGVEGAAGFFGSIGIPFPTLSVYLAGGTELFGGIALALGLFARVVSVPLAFTILVAIVTVHHSAFGLAAGGMEYALTLGVASLAIALGGAGRWTLDRAALRFLRGERRPAPALA